jgi:hypothetical protein
VLRLNEMCGLDTFGNGEFNLRGAMRGARGLIEALEESAALEQLDHELDHELDVTHNGVPQWPVRQQLEQSARKRRPPVELVI